MKIAFITQSYPPMISGASLVVERLALGMAERGHSVLVIAASDRGGAYVSESQNLKVIRLASVPNPKRACQQFTPIALREVSQALRIFQPDLLHIHDTLSLGVAGVLACRELKVPVIATLHQLPWFISAYLPSLPGLKTVIESGLWSYSRWLNRQCQQMIVPSHTIARTVEKWGGFPTITISNGVDLGAFTPSVNTPRERETLCRKYNLDPQMPVILHVGRLDADKSVDVVVRAAAQTLHRTRAQLLVVGDGTSRKSLIALARELNIHDRCRFPGFVSPTGDLPGLYRFAAVFTTASELETQCLVMLEAMASGLPVVAVRATCLHELVKDSVNGYLVNPGDTSGIARTLTYLLKNPDVSSAMGVMSRLISQSHDYKFTLNQYGDLYQTTIKGWAEKRSHEGTRGWAPKFKRLTRLFINHIFSITSSTGEQELLEQRHDSRRAEDEDFVVNRADNLKPDRR